MSWRETTFTGWVLLLAALAVQDVSARPVVSLGRDNIALVSTSRHLARIAGGSIVYLKDRKMGETLLDGSWSSPSVRFVERGAPVTVTAPGPRSFSATLVGKDAVRFVGRIMHGGCRDQNRPVGGR